MSTATQNGACELDETDRLLLALAEVLEKNFSHHAKKLRALVGT